jgi:hypothetical protein
MSGPSRDQMMNTNRPPKVKGMAIVANLAALNDLLTTAARRSTDAHELAQTGECNAAIGAILDVGPILDDAKALYGAALTLHRTK